MILTGATWVYDWDKGLGICLGVGVPGSLTMERFQIMSWHPACRSYCGAVRYGGEVINFPSWVMTELSIKTVLPAPNYRVPR